jgi:RHS repeat-associated protein
MMIAVMPSGETSEETQYVYAATTSGGSNVDSNDLLSATKYPDLTTGEAPSGQQETYTYNTLGQETGFADRDGNVHGYSFDLLGRKTLDAVTTLGSGVDGYPMAIGTAFNLQGLPYLYTSYSDADATTVVNQVENLYNGLGQLTEQYQEHSGAVDTSSTPNVQYGYSDLSAGSRKTSLTYPDGRQIDYNYASGVDSDISRLTSISDDATSTTLESYKYLGLGTIVERDHPETGVNLTYIGEGVGDGGDMYIGLDRFGRVIDQKWVTSTGTVKDEYLYGYDRDSNVLYKLNELSTGNSELYAYDDLNRLVEFERGTLSSDHTAITGTPSETETWTLDALGNQLIVVVNGSATVNTYNAENELVSNEVDGSGSSARSYDANGNLLTNDSDWNNYLYDAWNRNVGDAYGGGATPISSDGVSGSEQYAYDALGRRIYNAATGQDIYYDGWQRIEDAVTSAEPTETSDGPADVDEYVWSPAYENAVVERDSLDIMSYGGGLYTANLGTQRLYATQDADWNTTALIDTSGNVVERYQYDPYGQVTYLDSSFTPLTTQASNYNWVYLFQGGVLDNNNLYWFENRDENPALGNWAEQDPAGYVDGADEYQFVESSPIDDVDPSGLDAEPVGRIESNPAAVAAFQAAQERARDGQDAGAATAPNTINGGDSVGGWAATQAAGGGGGSSSQALPTGFPGARPGQPGDPGYGPAAPTSQPLPPGLIGVSPGPNPGQVQIIEIALGPDGKPIILIDPTNGQPYPKPCPGRKLTITGRTTRGSITLVFTAKGKTLSTTQPITGSDGTIMIGVSAPPGTVGTITISDDGNPNVPPRTFPVEIP